MDTAITHSDKKGDASAFSRKDCFGCRVVGTTVFLGVSAYLASALLRRPAPSGLHRAAIVTGSASFLVLAAYRAVA